MHMPRHLFVLPLALAAAPALAGGFYLQEQSPLAIGRAFAGEAAIGDSAATIWFNPAGMTRLPGVALELGSQLLFVDSRQRDTGSTRGLPGSPATVPTGGGDGGNPFDRPVFVPAGYGSFQFNGSNLWLGLGVSAPFGVKVVYDDGWFGRYDSLRSDVKTLNIQPSAAYRFGEHLSVGGGVDIQRMTATLTSALPNLSPLQPDGLIGISGQDLAFGWNAGVLGDFGRVRLGAHWRSHVSHNLSGIVRISGLLGPLAAGNGGRRGFAPLSTPDIASVGGVFDGGRWRLLASGSWYNWSRFERISVENNGITFLDSEQNYRDTWSGSGGGEVDLSPALTLRAGAMYDQTPTRDGFRTTRVPDGNRVWATAGATYHVTPAIALNVSYAHVWVATSPVDRLDPLFEGTPAQIAVRTRSENSGSVNILGGSVSARF